MLKKLLSIFIFFIVICVFGQFSSVQIDSIADELKQKTIIDKDDTEVLEILNRLYEDVLQSDEGELSLEASVSLNNFYTNENSKNLHILTLLLIYQEYFLQVINNEIIEDSNYQLALIQKIEAEIRNLYDEIPAIIYIYKVESLETNGLRNDVETVLQEGLAKFPDSIPLKVYTYLITNDSSIKDFLVKNHPDHWMVKQFGIN